MARWHYCCDSTAFRCRSLSILAVMFTTSPNRLEISSVPGVPVHKLAFLFLRAAMVSTFSSSVVLFYLLRRALIRCL